MQDEAEVKEEVRAWQGEVDGVYGLHAQPRRWKRGEGRLGEGGGEGGRGRGRQ